MAKKDWAAERKAQKDREADQAKQATAREKEAAWNREQDAHEANLAAWRRRAGADRKLTLADFIKIGEEKEAQRKMDEKAVADAHAAAIEQDTQKL
mgnify:CR=1 FL=1